MLLNILFSGDESQKKEFNFEKNLSLESAESTQAQSLVSVPAHIENSGMCLQSHIKKITQVMKPVVEIRR